MIPIVNCQLCGRFITKEQWNNHLYSSRRLHREAHAYWPAFFPQRKLGKDEKIQLENAFWKKFFATRTFTEVEEFWLTFFYDTK